MGKADRGKAFGRRSERERILRRVTFDKVRPLVDPNAGMPKGWRRIPERDVDLVVSCVIARLRKEIRT